jgi:micrococcal nuclease
MFEPIIDSWKKLPELAQYGIIAVGAIIVLFFVYRFLKLFGLYFGAIFRGKITRIYKVVDGDTIHVGTKKNKKTVRLIGVDTPESLRSMYMDVQPFGKEASDYSKKRLKKGSRVVLRYDKEKEDKFGRLLAYVYLGNGELFNASLVKHGYAFAKRYKPNVKKAPYFEKLEAKAKSQKKGVWKIYKNPKELRASYKKSAAYRKFKEKH